MLKLEEPRRPHMLRYMEGKVLSGRNHCAKHQLPKLLRPGRGGTPGVLCSRSVAAVPIAICPFCPDAHARTSWMIRSHFTRCPLFASSEPPQHEKKLPRL